MGRKKIKVIKAAAPDASLGEQAYALASKHRAALDPRLPTGTVEHLGADLMTLGVSPPHPASALLTEDLSPPPRPPSLADALQRTTNLVTAIHEAVRASKPKPEVRKAYGTQRRAVGKDLKNLIAAAKMIIAEATANAAQALGIGILSADVSALEEAVAELIEAEALAEAHGGRVMPTIKEKHTAALRMRAGVERIAGAGALAFAQDAAVRAQFEALLPKKQA